MKGLDPGAYWERLELESEPVPEPVNLDDMLRPPHGAQRLPNVKGNNKTKFAMSNWTLYSNMKSTRNNLGAGIILVELCGVILQVCD